MLLQVHLCEALNVTDLFINLLIMILQVHLCEALNVTDFLGDDFLVNRTAGAMSMMVAVKMLRRNADDMAR